MMQLSICYVLAYKAPDYIRTQSILHALCQIPGVKLYLAINQSAGPIRYLEVMRKVYEIHRHHKPDVYLLGFRGYELYWPLCWLVDNKPIILDALMSPYDALCSERKSGLLGSIVAPLWRPIENSILHDAQLVLTDTSLHMQYFAQKFSLPLSKLLALPVGAVEKTACGPYKVPPYGVEMSVLFYGSFLPLHGVDVILQAARMLGDLPLRFDFIGGGHVDEIMLDRNFPRNTRVTYTYRPWVPFDELINHVIPQADLCLGGPFGDTNQARRVVTGKTSQCLALGKPTVVGIIDEDYGFVDKQNCLLVAQGNPEKLADAVRWAWNNRDMLGQIGANGKLVYEQHLSLREIKRILVEALRKFVDGQVIGRHQ